MRKHFLCLSVFLGAAVELAEAQTSRPALPSQVAFDSTGKLPPLVVVAREREIALARAAGPEVVTASATIWVMGPAGYEMVREGTTGWACFVQRDYTGKQIFPRCDDPDRVTTLYPIFFLLEELRVRGKSARDYESTVGEGYRQGRFRQPPSGSMSYMYADHADPRIPPHVMISRPHCRAPTLGLVHDTQLSDSALGVTLLQKGLPTCDIIIFTPPQTGRQPATGDRPR